MRIRKTAVVAASLAALRHDRRGRERHAAAAEAAPATQAATRQFEGTIVSVNRSARTFRLRDSERGTVTIKVTAQHPLPARRRLRRPARRDDPHRGQRPPLERCVGRDVRRALGRRRPPRGGSDD